MGQLIISAMPQGQLGCQAGSNGQSCTLSGLESTSAGNAELPRTTVVATRYTTLVLSESPSTTTSNVTVLQRSSTPYGSYALLTNSSTQCTTVLPSTTAFLLSSPSSSGTTYSASTSTTTTSVTSAIQAFVTATIPRSMLTSATSTTNNSSPILSTTELAQSTASTSLIPSILFTASSNPRPSSELATSILLPLPSQYTSPPRYHAPHFVSEQIQTGLISQKARLAGGVAGAISGLTLIFLIILLLWRRRRRKPSSIPRPPSRPAIARARPYLPTKNSMRDIYREKGTPKLPEIAVTQTPVIDGNLIRMSLDHWSRPYAHTDPLRSAHAQHSANSLRITNPDPVRNDGDTTLSPDNPRRFMSRQRSALAVVLATFKRTPSWQTIPQAQARLSPVPDAASRAVSPQSSMLESHHPSPLLPSPDPFVQTQRGLPIRLVVSRTPSYDSRPLTVASLRATAGEGEGEDRVMDRFLDGRRDV